jgi:hypothetical protein
MMSLYASAGAFIGTLMVFLGHGVHFGQAYYYGAPAYALSALAGAAAALVIRHAIRKEFGPIIP